MRRNLMFAVGVASLVAVTCGEAAAQKKQPADPVNEWRYPKAAHLGAGGGSSGNYIVMATTDGLEKVAAFYDKKLGGKKLTAGRPGGMVLAGGDEEVEVMQDNSVQPGVKSEQRPVAVRIFVQRTKDYYLTLVITRATAEDRTHISLTCILK